MGSSESVTVNACGEYRTLMSRRGFLGGLGLAGAATLGSLCAPRVAFADSHRSDRDVLVTIFLRGGADGLTLCVPHGDKSYYAHRPTLAIPRPDSRDPNRCTDLDGFFGFPPGMAALLPAYRAGHLLAVH